MLTDSVTLSVFGVSVYAYGLIAGGAFLLWALVTSLLCRHRQGGLETALFVFASLVLGFVCSRAVYCLGSIPYYVISMRDAGLMLRFWDGGYSLIGAFLGVGLAAAIVGKATKKPALRFLDGAAVAAPLFVCGIRIAEHFTKLGFGRVVEGDWLPSFLTLVDEEWEMTEYAVYRMEAGCAFIIFIIMAWQLVVSRKSRRRGDMAFLFMVLFGSLQTLLESWCKDGHMVIHFIKVSQLASLLLVMAAAIVWTKRYVAIRGRNTGLLLAWIGFFALAGAAVFLEFKADRWENQLLVYSLFALCVAYWLAFPLAVWHKLKKTVYREDTIGVRIGVAE